MTPDEYIEAILFVGADDATSSAIARQFARGAFGSPTFFRGDAISFGRERLREIEGEIIKAQNS